MKIVAVSGYFDPLHVGHLDLFERSKKLGDKLIVIVNNDSQSKLKKGSHYIPHDERMRIVKALECVDDVVLSIDEDLSVCETLRSIKPDVFAQGGDRKNYEVPEAVICKELGIEMVDGMGEKIQASSEILKRILGDVDVEEVLGDSERELIDEAMEEK